MYEELSKELIKNWRARYNEHKVGRPTLRETIGQLKFIYKINNPNTPLHIINEMIINDMELEPEFRKIFSRRPDQIKAFFKTESKEELEETQKLLI